MKRNFIHSLTLSLSICAVLLTLHPSPAAARGKPSWPIVVIDGQPGLLLADIELRPGVTVDLFVEVHGKLHPRRCELAIHGGLFTAASWRPYARAPGPRRCVLAVNLPGRDGSTFPTGVMFGELDLDDYVTAALATLEHLETLGIEPRALLGHSMGGTLVQMMQQRLIDDGTSLRARFGIRDAILVASDLPAEVPWELGDSGDLSDLIDAFAVIVPGLGVLFQIPLALWPAFYFTDLDGDLVPGAPTPERIDARGWSAPLGEPLLAIHQLNGTGGFESRPSIDAGIFAGGTRLRLVTYEQDIFVLTHESEALYVHLTGDTSLACVILVHGADSTHAMHLINPRPLVRGLQRAARCRY